MTNKFRSINEVRDSIDKLDLEIIELISKRKDLVNEAVKLKTKDQIVDQKRIDEIIQRLSALAERLDIPGKMVVNIWNCMIEGFIEYEKTNFEKIKKS
tara:strand:- start:651 stop:944 length:294 start_codon:yes stop_codon:yes gene_type:complete